VLRRGRLPILSRESSNVERVSVSVISAPRLSLRCCAIRTQAGATLRQTCCRCRGFHTTSCYQSPDGLKTVALRLLDDDADDFPTEVKVSTTKTTLVSTIEFGLNAEILWSEDSRAFSISGSSEGANGRYHTDVFVLRGNRLNHARLTGLIENAFGHPVKCGWPESPNVAAIKWLERGSIQILVAAEIINHSNCDSMGTFKAYRVDVEKRQITRIYDQLKAKNLFGAELGPELKDANDACITKPTSCYVSTNHPELDHKRK
jgi:hypothetical protein